MPLTAIVDRIESFQAFQMLQLTLFRDAELFPHQALGHQGGSRRKTVLWLRKYNLWAVLDISAKEGSRYWNCFGRGKPDPQQGLGITVEINPPHEGINKRLAGMFARDEHGHRYIAHNGRIGGGRRDVSPTGFRNFLRHGWSEIQTPGGSQDAMAFGPLDQPAVAAQLVAFVRRVEEFKHHATSN